MLLKTLQIKQLRNLTDINLELVPGFNGFFGDNGSGKTSILEAIYLLGLKQSFRVSQANKIIQDQQHSFTVFANTAAGHKIGVEKHHNTTITSKLNGEINPSKATIAKLMPMQLINSDSFKLLDSGPKLRREFIDWGLFHVEPEFFTVWSKYHSALKQRNAALKQHANLQVLQSWDLLLVKYGKSLHKMRLDYVQAFNKLLLTVTKQLLPVPLTVKYQAGWPSEQSLADSLIQTLNYDYKLGFTSNGPHRADLAILARNNPAHLALSRGQQKILICGLKITQGMLLKNTTNSSCIYLVDDIAAELDIHNNQLVTAMLKDINAQVFVTGIEQTQLLINKDAEYQLFHVKQGFVSKYY